MSIRVWHLDDSSFFGPDGHGSPPKEFLDAKMGFRKDGSQEAACAELFKQGKYYLAGIVESDNMDKAFEWTNTIDGPWQDNPGVEASPGSQRSTSVGDLFELPGHRWIAVASCGFSEVPMLGKKESAPAASPPPR
jgi:hypothetical protein